MTRTIAQILVPTDFSPPSDAALEYATTLAKRFGASLRLLHVVEDPFGSVAWGSEVYIPSVPTMRAELIDEAAHKLSRLLPYAERQSVAARSEVRVGRPADVIRQVALEHACDLIVMGTNGRTGVTHLLLGSVAETLVREAPCPVLTVKGTGAGVAAQVHEHECAAGK